MNDELAVGDIRQRMSNCIYLRCAGSDEVAGVTPDLPILPSEGDDDRARAQGVPDVIAADVVGE